LLNLREIPFHDSLEEGATGYGIRLVEIRADAFYRFLYWFGGKNEIVHRQTTCVCKRQRDVYEMRSSSVFPRHVAEQQALARFLFLLRLCLTCLLTCLFAHLLTYLITYLSVLRESREGGRRGRGRGRGRVVRFALSTRPDLGKIGSGYSLSYGYDYSALLSTN